MTTRWESKAQMRARMDSMERYNRYLQGEVRRQHGKVMRLRKSAEKVFTSIDLNEKRLFREVHGLRRDEDTDFALGWNQAVGHIERRIIDLLGFDTGNASDGCEEGGSNGRGEEYS